MDGYDREARKSFIGLTSWPEKWGD